MKNWQNLFLESALNNGYTYFIEKRVHEFLCTKEQITAQVLDNESYSIRINLTENKQIYSMICDCSHKKAEHCKHIAAVLFEYDHRWNLEPPNKLIKLLSYADEIQIRDFLLTILLENKQLAKRFKEQFPINQLEDYERLTAIISKYHKQSQGNLSTKMTENLIFEIIEFMQTTINQAIQKKQIFRAFELVNKLVEIIDSEKINNLDNHISLLMNHCYSFWKELIPLASEQDKKRMFSELLSQANNIKNTHSKTSIQQLLQEEFPEQSQLDEQNKLTQPTAPVTSETGRKTKRYLSIRQMENLNYTKKQIQNCAHENWQSSSVRSQYIDYLLHKKEYTEAIDVLNESILLDQHSPDMVTLHRYSLKNLYQKFGNTERYAEQILHLLLESETVDMNLIHQLKKAYSIEQWESLRETLFEQLKNRPDVGLFYSKERRYDLLLEYIIKSPGLDEASRYFSFLKKQFPEALLQKYEYELRKMAAITATRPYYHKISLLIEEMATLPGSTISTQLLIKELKEKYPRRKAMLEELERVEKKL
ncbi:MAG: SWIM zinc finger domain-containing protein [Enterococcus sp.]